MYEFQTREVKKVLLKSNVSFIVPKGAGKTRMALLWANNIKTARKLIVCPASALPVWVQESRKWLQKRCVPIIGDRAQKIRHLCSPRATWSVISYQSFRSVAQHLLMAGDLPYKYVILDESHNIKNPRAQVTKAVHLVLRKARYKAILTASPITNSELDAWAQWYFLDSGTSFGRSYWVFRDQYFIPDRNRWVWTPTMHFKHKFNQVLQKGIILDEDVIDLPSATFSQHYVDLHPKQKKAYHQLEQEFRLYLKNLKEPVIDTQWAVVRFTKMRQILSGFVIDDKKQVHVLPCNKYSQLISILEEELPKHKVVIWCLWSEEIRQVCKVLDAMAISYVKYDGSLDFAQRDSAVRFFQTDPDVRVFVGQVQAGGEAITLTASDRVVYMSQTLSIRYRDQSEGRTRRIGSEKHKHINYTDMLTTDTLETAMYEGIKERRYTNQMLLYRHLLSHVKLSDGGKKRS